MSFAIDDGPVPPNKVHDADWFFDAPTEPGLFWFFGEPHMGAMGGHYSGTVEPEMRLMLVQVHKASNGLLAETRGHFITLSRWNGEREGYLGMWARCSSPDVSDSELTELILKGK